MDPLDVLTNKENVIPYFQPIFSADEQMVIGYEVLGRYMENDDIHSLGPFFSDDSIPEEYRIEIDDHIQMQALEQILNHEDMLLFLNRDANLLMRDHGESFLSLLISFQDRGLSLNRIVIEITEHEFKGDIEELDHLLKYYKTYGIRVAVDNVGKDGSNLDRLRQIQPDILKVDLKILKQTTDVQAYQDIFQSLSFLARKIGATLLYEDIEVAFQFQYAWRHSGRLYQGFYFARPLATFVESDLCKEKMKNEFHRFILHEKRKLQAQYNITEQLHERLEKLNLSLKGKAFDEVSTQIAEVLSDCSFRVYICDEDGFQVSSNIRKKADEWKTQPKFVGKNWSWRPYFLENMVRMNYVKKGILSDLYSDMETGETIRTFSYPIGSDFYAFIDLPYVFIYENDALL